jgi:hypothetical protein
LPFHEIIGPLIKPLGKLSIKFFSVRAASGLAWNLLRTAGFFYVQGSRGLRPEQQPVERLLTFPRRFPGIPHIPTGPPLLGSFLTGIAYENVDEMAEGWLSWQGELIAAPLVDTKTEQAIKSAARTDFWGVMDALGEAFAEETRLEDAAAFVKGVAQVKKDWEAVTGITIPSLPWDFIGDLVVWANDTLQGRLQELPEPKPPGGPARPEDTLKGLKGLVRSIRLLGMGQLPPLFKVPRKVSKRLQEKVARLVGT